MKCTSHEQTSQKKNSKWKRTYVIFLSVDINLPYFELNNTTTLSIFINSTEGTK